MKFVTVSAPGKIHLSGEHSVVYGKPALLAATSRRLKVTLIENQELINESQRSIEAQNLEFRIQNLERIEGLRERNGYFDVIVKQVEKEFQVKFKNVYISIKSDIPVGVGMGSSAALAVATIGALIAYLGKPWDVRKINELAYQAEKFQHGNPSGGDNTIACYGGFLWYRKELEFLKSIWSLSLKIPRSFPPILLVNTARSESTAEMVKLVANMKANKPKYFQQLLNDFELVTKIIARAIHAEDAKLFKNSLNQNQRLLEKIGVVSTTTQKLVRQLQKLGAAVKVSGAGGVSSGSGLLLVIHQNLKQVKKFLLGQGLKPFQVDLGGEGVRRERIVR